MGDRAWGRFVALAIGLGPVILAALTWGPHGLAPWMPFLRIYALPVLVIEVAVILIALAAGLVDAVANIRLPRPAGVAVLVLGAVMVGTVPFAPQPMIAARFTAIWFIHAFFGLSVMHLARRAFSVDDLVGGYGFGFVLFCGLLAVLLPQVTDPSFDWSGGLPAVSHVRILGHYAAPMAGLAAGLLAQARTSSRWAAALGLAVLALGLAFWTGSRGALIGATSGLIAALLFSRTMRRPRAWGGWLAAVVLGWLVAAILPTPGANMGSARIIASTVQSSDVTTGRLQLWSLVLSAIEKRPAFGYGEGQMYFVAKFADVFHPHDVILQVLLSWGVIGLASIVTLAFYFARESIILIREGNDELLPPFIALVALTVPSLIDGSLWHPLPVSIFSGCVGLMASKMRRRVAGA